MPVPQPRLGALRGKSHQGRLPGGVSPPAECKIDLQGSLRVQAAGPEGWGGQGPSGVGVRSRMHPRLPIGKSCTLPWGGWKGASAQRWTRRRGVGGSTRRWCASATSPPGSGDCTPTAHTAAASLAPSPRGRTQDPCGDRPCEARPTPARPASSTAHECGLDPHSPGRLPAAHPATPLHPPQPPSPHECEAQALLSGSRISLSEGLTLGG